MIKYIIKRILYIIPTFLLITFAVFAILSISGDPVASILGGSATEEQVLALREELGLNKNIIVRYGEYMFDVFRGDFGTSWTTETSVFDVFITRLPRTLMLTFMALLLTAAIGIPLGVLVAVKQYSITDRVTTVITMLFISMPEFFVALMAQLLFGVILGWLPVTGIDSLVSYVMPAFVLGASRIASQVRLTRSSMLDVIGQDYIRTAYVKGASKPRVIFKHALRNSLLPVVTSLGTSVAGLMAGSTVIETVFAIPGVGSMLMNGVNTKDVPMVMGPIIFISLVVCTMSMIVDLVYAVIDPRVRLQFSNK